MNKDEFKKYFNDYKDVTIVDENKLNKIIAKWKEFRAKIINKTITAEEYNSKNEYFANFKNGEYSLRYFCETVVADFFGSLGTMVSSGTGLFVTGDKNNKEYYYDKPHYPNKLTDQEKADKLLIIQNFLYDLVTQYKWKDLINFLDGNSIFNNVITCTNFIYVMVILNSLLSENDLIENTGKADNAKVEYDYYLQLIHIYKDYDKIEKLQLFSECAQENHTNRKLIPFLKSKKVFELSKDAIGNIEVDHKIKFLLDKVIWLVAHGSTSCTIEGKLMDYITNNCTQVILTGAPGTGKTYSAKKVADYFVVQGASNKNDIMEFVQFHPSFDYTDFVEGLRPVQLKPDQDPTFVRFDGVFKSFCRKVVEQNKKKSNNEESEEFNDSLENQKYFFIIDEINRADLSKVFGELMYSLEYRGEEGRVKTQYSNLKTYYYDDNNEIKAYNVTDDVFADGFYIPKNIIIIGTMNDIDRSVESFDFALRRRFKWIDVKANEVMGAVLKNFIQDDKCREVIITKMKNLNEAIYNENEDNGMGLSEAYHIGPAYLKSLQNIIDKDALSKTLNNIYTYEISSILYEYVRGRDTEQVKQFLNNCKAAFEKEQL